MALEAGSTTRMEKLDPHMNGHLELGQQLDELITYKRDTLKTLQQAVISEQATLVNAKQEIERLQREAKYAQQVEQGKFKDSLQAEKEGMQVERRSLEHLDLEIEGRRKEVEVLEAKASPIAEALKKLQDERLAIEQQRIRNEELRVENDHLANATSTMHEEMSQLKIALLRQQTVVNRQAVEQEQTQKRLDSQQKDVALQIENLTAIKLSVDPKLSETRKLQEQAEADRHQVEVLRDAVTKQQSELDKQRSDLAILSSQLQAKADALTEYDASLKRTEAELRIKLQQAKLEKVEVVMPEKPIESPKV